MALGAIRTVLASEARTASGASPGVGLGADVSARVAVGLSVTASGGVSPTLDVAVEWSHDDGATWLKAQSADSFSQATAATAVVKVFDVKGPLFRAVYTVGGTTPTFTFAVTAVPI